MINLRTLSGLVFLLIISCSKKEIQGISTWYFNGEKTSTTSVDISENQSGSFLFAADRTTSSLDRKSGFVLNCGLGSFPPVGTYSLYNGPVSTDLSLLRLFIFKNGKEYRLSKNNEASITIFVENKKRKFELAEVWFTSTVNDQDSALVKGTFCEP